MNWRYWGQWRVGSYVSFLVRPNSSANALKYFCAKHRNSGQRSPRENACFVRSSPVLTVTGNHHSAPAKGSQTFDSSCCWPVCTSGYFSGKQHYSYWAWWRIYCSWSLRVAFAWVDGTQCNVASSHKSLTAFVFVLKGGRLNRYAWYMSTASPKYAIHQASCAFRGPQELTEPNGQ